MVDVAVGHGTLVRFRVMAITTAILLIVLVFVGVPLQLFAGNRSVVNTVGTLHGFLYLVYLVVAFDLTRKLAIPKWQMFLVLLAGTVPLCAFVAERKMTRRFASVEGGSSSTPGGDEVSSGAALFARFRRRWLSRRALLLHLEVVIVAPGCAAAGWWQATRALGGNGLSWFYSVEWPVFALLAIGGWWFLIHEDPAAYRERKTKPSQLELPDDTVSDAARAVDGLRVPAFDVPSARLATALAALVTIEFVLGVVTLVLLRPSRASGFIPARWQGIYLAHAVLGVPLGVGAIALVARVRRSPRISRLSGWIGSCGVAVASLGGVLTGSHPARLAGIAVMFVGAVVALFGYLFPVFDQMDSRPRDGTAVRP